MNSIKSQEILPAVSKIVLLFSDNRQLIVVAYTQYRFSVSVSLKEVKKDTWNILWMCPGESKGTLTDWGSPSVKA